MGHKKVIYPVTLFNAANGVMTGTNTIQSIPMSIENVDNIRIQLAWTGTPTGTISVQMSGDGVQYDALTFNPLLAQPAGAPGQYAIEINQTGALSMILQYVNASGVGALTASYTAKDLN